MEGSDRGRSDQLLRAVLRLRGGCALAARLGRRGELARGCGDVDDLGRGRVRSDDRIRFNATDYGKTVLAACFITDLGTVIALGLIFAPFTPKTALFVGGLAAAAFALPWLTPFFFRRFGGRPSEMEAKFLLLFLFGLGALAGWADSEAV